MIDPTKISSASIAWRNGQYNFFLLYLYEFIAVTELSKRSWQTNTSIIILLLRRAENIYICSARFGVVCVDIYGP